MALSGTGLFTPAQSITNAELVESFNEYVRRHNKAHPDAPLAESSTDFIMKASGIGNRYVMDRMGILDPEVMRPILPERPNEQISILAEMAVAAGRGALKPGF